MRWLLAAVLAVALATGAAVVIALAAPAPRGPADAHVDTQPAARAEPGLVWRSGGMVLQLTDRPCPFEEFRAELEEEGIPPARAYVVSQAGRSLTGCWAPAMGGDVLTRRLDAEPGTVPLQWFKRSLVP